MATKKTAPKKAPEPEPAKKPAAKRTVAAKKAPAKGRAAKAAPEAVEKRPVGRPPEYRDEFCQMMIDYFNIEVERVEQIMIPDPKVEGGFRTESKTILNTFPTLTRFASKIGVTRKTLHEWATEVKKDGTVRRPEFSYAYARAKDLQESLIVEGGMAGLYESRFAGLAAKNLAGWRDQIEQVIEQNITSTTKEVLDDTYKNGMENAKKAREEMLKRRQKRAGQGEAE